MESPGSWWGGLDHKAAGCRAQRVMGLVLAHRWAESGSVVGGCAAKGPRYSVSLFRIGLVLDMVDCSVGVSQSWCPLTGEGLDPGMAGCGV